MKNALFQVDGKPFFSVGAQMNNSSSYDAFRLERAFHIVKKTGLNTVAAPVYWECLEPEEGVYDDSQITGILEMAEKYDLHVTVLWFGTWKNGNSHYIPEWVKTDHERFTWVRTADGTPVRTISPACQAACERDCAAFTELCRYIAKADTGHRVLAIQVENEPGIIGSARDYSQASQEEFEGQVPQPVAEYAGKTGTWEEVFGFDAAEFYSAWKFSTYIEKVVEAGKAVTDLPMYTNVWLGEMHSRIAGVDYPSGGAVCKTLELFRIGAPGLDTISPDTYLQDMPVWKKLNAAYEDGVHPYYIPELMPSALAATEAIQAVVENGLCGVHFFGLDALAGPDDSILPPFAEAVNSLKTLVNMKPLIEKYQGSGKLYAVTQYEGMSEQYIDFGDYIGSVRFDNRNNDLMAKKTDGTRDNLHMFADYSNERGKGLICYEGDGKFWLAGNAWRLMLYPKSSIEAATNAAHSADFLNQRTQAFLTVREGYFDETGTYQITRRRNGDEADYGFWVTPDVGVVEVRMDANFR